MLPMKISQYAKNVGVTYKTAYQIATCSIIVREKTDEGPVIGRIAMYAQASSLEQKEDLEWLRDYAAAKGYQYPQW